jgi:ATP-dependent DNA helicase RecQ
MAPPTEAVLRLVFGHAGLRPGQAEAIDVVRAGGDALVVMPTGGGKSLCYQLPAVADGGLTLVVSPLIALMKDQVDALRARGVAAAALNSQQSGAASSAALRAAVAGRLPLLYVSPERLAAPGLQAALRAAPIRRVVIDEAHCVVRWGHDFRPDYLSLKAALDALGAPPVVALTATATVDEQREILRAVGRPGARRVVTGFDRPELYFAVRAAPTGAAKERALAEVLRRVDGAVLVYTGTRAEADDLAAALVRRYGATAAAYHAGLSAGRRAAVHDAFHRGELRVVAATSAFGMGVDKPDVRAVVHWTMPFDLTSYYQAAGRAGRDGERALCLLLYGPEDQRLRAWQIATVAPSASDLGALLAAVHAVGRDGELGTERIVADGAGLALGRARAGLAALGRAGIVRRVGGAAGPWVVARAPGAGELGALAGHAAARATARHAELLDAVRYSTADGCRRASLLAHFGERRPAARPGCCDHCDRTRRATTDPVRVAARGAAPEPALASAAGAGRAEPALLERPMVPEPIDEKVLSAVGAMPAGATLRTVTTAVAAATGGAQAARPADVRAAIDRLVALGELVLHHGAGPARMALTRRGHERLQGEGGRIAESATPYRVPGRLAA